MSETAPLEFQDVTRRFGRTAALDCFSLRIEPGQVLGLLGRNGAGKTTALRLAHGLLHPDEGSIRVLGLDPVREGRALRARVSLLEEESALYPWMTVEQIVGFAGALHPRWDAGRARELQRQLDLDPARKIRALSRGTRAKVALVLAIACRPDLLLLDDPTAGLDPLVRREVLEEILGAVPAEGGSVIYASHLVHDVERVADRVVVLDAGRVALDGGLDEIKARTRRAVAVFDDDAPERVALEGALDQQRDGRVLRIVAKGTNGDLEARLRALGARDVHLEPLPLEEILVACLRRDGSEEARRG